MGEFAGALIEEHVVSPDPETCTMLRKPLGQQAKKEAIMRGFGHQPLQVCSEVSEIDVSM